MKTKTKDSYIQRIDRVVGFLNEQVEGTPSLKDLADVAAISPFHFHRVYRAITGETPSGTLRRLRLARAARLLKETGKPVTEIAFDVGYETSQSFSKAFREVAGCSASDLRSNAKKLQKIIKELSNPPRGQKAENKAMAIKLVSVEPFKVIAYRKTGPHSELSKAYRRLFNWAEKTGVVEGFKGIYGVPIDDPRAMPPEECRFDCCFDFGPDAIPGDVFREARLGGGSYAVLRHQGPYEGLEEKYDYLFGPWLLNAGYALRDAPMFNHYLNDPDTAPPEEWITDIHLPVEKIT